MNILKKHFYFLKKLNLSINLYLPHSHIRSIILFSLNLSFYPLNLSLTPQTTSSSECISGENGKTNVSRRFSNENWVWVRFNPVPTPSFILIQMLTGCYLNFMQDSCVLRLSMLFVPASSSTRFPILILCVYVYSKYKWKAKEMAIIHSLSHSPTLNAIIHIQENFLKCTWLLRSIQYIWWWYIYVCWTVEWDFKIFSLSYPEARRKQQACKKREESNRIKASKQADLFRKAKALLKYKTCYFTSLFPYIHFTCSPSHCMMPMKGEEKKSSSLSFLSLLSHTLDSTWFP